jgi:hypothetical protein
MARVPRAHNAGPARCRTDTVRLDRRDLLASGLVYGPAVAWLVYAVRAYGPTRGYGRVLPLALVVAVGLVGLMAVFVAYFPVTVERLGFARFGAWLRTWWDRDAK